MHTPMSSRRARSIASRKRVHEPDVDAQRVRVLDRERRRRRAARLGEHGRERGLERVGGLLPRERRERPGREHHALGARPRPRSRSSARAGPAAASQLVGSARWNGPRPMRFATRSPRSTASATSCVPSSQPNASSFATDTPTVVMPCRSQNARSSSSESPNVEIALTHARGASHCASAEREAAGDAAAAVELEVDAGHELRLAAREVHRRVRDVGRRRRGA